LDPAFTDITWGAGGSTSDLSMQIALQLHKTGHQSNMHLTCTNIQNFTGDPKQAVSEALQTAWDGGIRNIVALRGDPPAGENEWKVSEGGFTCGLDLVVFIREKYGDGFGISVAGYPEGHPNAISEMEDPSSMTATEKARSSNFDGKTYCCKDADYKKEMDYLKQKVDAGAGACRCCVLLSSIPVIAVCVVKSSNLNPSPWVRQSDPSNKS
jgi:methylenetetrahydrofolate reductase (NADPH)